MNRAWEALIAPASPAIGEPPWANGYAERGNKYPVGHKAGNANSYGVIPAAFSASAGKQEIADHYQGAARQ